MLHRYTQKKNIILSRSKSSCVRRLMVKVTPTIRDQYIRTLAGFGLRVCERDSCSLWTECKVHYLLLLLLFLSLIYAYKCVCVLVRVCVISLSVCMCVSIKQVACLLNLRLHFQFRSHSFWSLAPFPHSLYTCNFKLINPVLISVKY